MTDAPHVDVRTVAKVVTHLESDEILGVRVGDGDEVLEFLTRLAMDDVEALVGSALDPRELRSLLAVLEHKKGTLDDDQLPVAEAARRAELVEAGRRIARDRASTAAPQD